MLDVRHLTVSYGPLRAVDDIGLTVETGRTVAVLGPSGSGKSSLLRAVAGLEPAARGQITLGGTDITSTPPYRRRLGLMFQEHTLFPHLNVAGNVGFGLRAQRMPRRQRAARVAEVLDLVGLTGYSNRPIHTLSGGQRQRTALARALAPSPALLMLDEPFGQLDRALADRLVGELRDLFDKLQVTVLAVTHNHDDAFGLADEVAIMNDGRIVRRGSPADVWRDPGTRFVAEFLGFTNIVAAQTHAGNLVTPWGTFSTAGPAQFALVRPQGVAVDTEGPLSAVVTGTRFRGDHIVVDLAPVDAPPLQAALPPATAVLPAGEVRISIDPAHVVPLAG